MLPSSQTSIFVFQVYSRIKQIEEFEERQEEFADVLIPFCKAANIPLSAKLLKLSKTQETTDRAPSKNGTPMDGTPVNGTNSNGTPRNSTPGDRTPLNGVGAHLPDGMNNSTSSVHSVMMEQMNKNDVFNDDRDKQAEDELNLTVEGWYLLMFIFLNLFSIFCVFLLHDSCSCYCGFTIF